MSGPKHPNQRLPQQPRSSTCTHTHACAHVHTPGYFSQKRKRECIAAPPPASSSPRWRQVQNYIQPTVRWPILSYYRSSQLLSRCRARHAPRLQSHSPRTWLTGEPRWNLTATRAWSPAGRCLDPNYGAGSCLQGTEGLQIGSSWVPPWWEGSHAMQAGIAWHSATGAETGTPFTGQSHGSGLSGATSPPEMDTLVTSTLLTGQSQSAVGKRGSLATGQPSRDHSPP